MGKLFACFGKPAVSHEDDGYQEVFAPIKPVQKGSGSRQQAVFLVMAPPISEGQSNTSSAGSESAVDTAEDEVWYDCEAEEWCEVEDEHSSSGITDDATQQSSPITATADESGLTQEQLSCLRALPARLSALLTKYLQGASLGCKPTVAVLKYMQDSNTTLAELQQLLQPLLAAEQHLPPQQPVPTPRCSPDETTAALRAQLQAAQEGVGSSGSAASSNNCVNSAAAAKPAQQRLAHLLCNLELTEKTLAVMHQQEGFKQVAWGPLEMWYWHDTASKSQIIRARVVLNEPISVVATVTREVDLVPSWNPGMADMCELAAYSPTEILIYNLMWTPWPLPMPEVVNYCYGLDMLDLKEKCVLLQTSSTELPAGLEVPHHTRTVPVHMNVGGFKLVPLPPLPDQPDVPRTEVTVLVSMDAASFVLPDSIISFILKVFAPLVHKSVLKVFKRAFHASDGPTAAAAGRCQSGGPGSARSAPSTASCSGGMLVERLLLRPEYAALDAHAQRFLAAQAPTTAAAGTAQALDLNTPRTTESGPA